MSKGLKKEHVIEHVMENVARKSIVSQMEALQRPATPSFGMPYDVLAKLYPSNGMTAREGNLLSNDTGKGCSFELTCPAEAPKPHLATYLDCTTFWHRASRKMRHRARVPDDTGSAPMKSEISSAAYHLTKYLMGDDGYHDKTVGDAVAGAIEETRSCIQSGMKKACENAMNRLKRFPAFGEIRHGRWDAQLPLIAALGFDAEAFNDEHGAVSEWSSKVCSLQRIPFHVI